MSVPKLYVYKFGAVNYYHNGTYRNQSFNS
jgi:hypothetical protein